MLRRRWRIFGEAIHRVVNRVLSQSFLQELRALEAAYLKEDDPIRQSGFSGGAERWRAERGPILDAIDMDGDLLDIGCANGFLLKCLVNWGGERGLKLTPHGLDQGNRLIELAKVRLPEYADNFHVGNAWDWRPPRKYRYVYMLYDCLPLDYLADGVNRLLERVVAPKGRLILGAYGSKSDSISPFDIGDFLKSEGFEVAGRSQGGVGPTTKFAWLDA